MIQHILIISSISIFYLVVDRDVKPQSSYSYTAAVVEFSPDKLQSSETPSELIQKNAARYVDVMVTASQHSVDIIVFPECGLTTLAIPASREHILPYLTEFPEIGSNPCDDPDVSKVLQMLSCAARKTRMYVVFNLPELFHCTAGQEDCSPDGKLIYNSNLALDRNGTIVARYRKFNLYVEPGFNITKTADHSWFDTDFGVRFGMFICFDILFKQPAMELISQYNVANFAYSTAWFQHLPFYIATSVKSGWAKGNDVNFLVSGYSDTSNSNAGSGIYNGNGPIAAILPDHSSTTLIISNISNQDGEKHNPTPLVIPISENENSSLTLLHAMDFRNFTTSIVSENEAKLVYHTDLFSCEVNVSLSNMIEGGPIYRLVAFGGNMHYLSHQIVYTEVCGVVACVDSTLQSCSRRADFQTPVVFDKLSISAVTKKTDLVTFVITVDKSLLPLSGESYKFNIQRQPENSSIRMCTESSLKNLIAFTVFRSG